MQELLPSYKHHYNFERPHQGRACRNQPPGVAFPDLPARPNLPLLVDPDRWLMRLEGNRYVRRVDYKGTVRLDKHKYYAGRELAHQYVALEIDAKARQVLIVNNKNLQVVKRMPIKGLYRTEMNFEEYAQLIVREARSERRVAQLRPRLARPSQPAA